MNPTAQVLDKHNKDIKEIPRNNYFTIDASGFYHPEDKPRFLAALGETPIVPCPITTQNGYVFDKFQYGKFTPDTRSFTDWMASDSTAKSSDLLSCFHQQHKVNQFRWKFLKSADIPVIQTKSCQALIILPDITKLFNHRSYYSMFNNKLKRLRPLF